VKIIPFWNYFDIGGKMKKCGKKIGKNTIWRYKKVIWSVNGQIVSIFSNQVTNIIES